MIFSLITANPLEARTAEIAGIPRIMIDLERNGKALRQKGKNLFLSSHRIDDVPLVRSTLKQASLVVRINPVHELSAREVEEAIHYGADYVMLPFFHRLEQVKTFHRLVKGRVRTILLLETGGAMDIIEAIAETSPPDEFHIGLNDLSICLGKNSIFDLFLDGTVESITSLLRTLNYPFGLGGVGALSRVDLPISPTLFLLEQMRLGATRGWLGRSFREPTDIGRLAIEFQSLLAVCAGYASNDAEKARHLHESFVTQIHRTSSYSLGNQAHDISSIGL